MPVPVCVAGEADICQSGQEVKCLYSCVFAETKTGDAAWLRSRGEHKVRIVLDIIVNMGGKFCPPELFRQL